MTEVPTASTIYYSQDVDCAIPSGAFVNDEYEVHPSISSRSYNVSINPIYDAAGTISTNIVLVFIKGVQLNLRQWLIGSVLQADGKKGFNMKKRLTNIYFWTGVAGLFFATIGIEASTLTSWGAVWDLAVDLVSNPFMLISVAAAMVGVFTDTSTKGLRDRVPEENEEQ
jgi:phi LC3 family holin